jgi:general secretion pathway protein D
MRCDNVTNTLVTTSSQRDYAQLRAVIEKLDQPRPQVFIEAVMIDVDVDRNTDWGFPQEGGQSFCSGERLGQQIFIVPENLEALALGVGGPGIQRSQALLNEGGFVQALGDSKVIETQYILGTDSEQATIEIGSGQINASCIEQLALAAVDQAVASAAGGSGIIGELLGVNGGGTRVSTKLEVTPHVSDSDVVRLEVKEEITDLGSWDGALGVPRTHNRTAATTVIVKDQQTVIIDGLREQDAQGETKIPVPGDIPIVGFLFNHLKEKRRSNPALVLTPHIVRSQDDLRAIFERKMRQRQEFLDHRFRDYQRNAGLSGAIH